MGLKETIQKLRSITREMEFELHKSEEGNKAASRRVRKLTLELTKVGKQYRKESIVADKKGKAPAKKSAPKKAASKAKKKKK